MLHLADACSHTTATRQAIQSICRLEMQDHPGKYHLHCYQGWALEGWAGAGLAPGRHPAGCHHRCRLLELADREVPDGPLWKNFSCRQGRTATPEADRLSECASVQDKCVLFDIGVMDALTHSCPPTEKRSLAMGSPSPIPLTRL